MTTLEVIYVMVPDVACKGLCVDACTIIGVYPAERRNLDRIGAKVNDINQLDDIEAARCPSLVAGRCSIYTQRPLICRLYGASEGLRCPYGCTPATGHMSESVARHLMALAEVAT